MSGYVAAAAVAVTSAVVWLQVAALPEPARLWTSLLMVPLPALMILQARQTLRIDEVSRPGAYASSILTLWLLAGATALVARVSDFRGASLGLFAGDPVRIALWTPLLTAGGIGVLFAFRGLGFREAPLLRDLLPQDTRDRVLFTGLSVTAGFCEELIFRGFLFFALLTATGSTGLALLLASGAFGVVHAYQQPVGALRAGLLGAILTLPLLFGEPLWAPILAHTFIDLLSGLWLARYLLR